MIMYMMTMHMLGVFERLLIISISVPMLRMLCLIQQHTITHMPIKICHVNIIDFVDQ
jgi:hypothetical protein